MLAAIEITTFTTLLKQRVLGARRTSGQFIPWSLFCQSVLRLDQRVCRSRGRSEEWRLGRPVFYGISKRTHLLNPLTPMIGVFGKQACGLLSDIELLAPNSTL